MFVIKPRYVKVLKKYFLEIQASIHFTSQLKAVNIQPNYVKTRFQTCSTNRKTTSKQGKLTTWSEIMQRLIIALNHWLEPTCLRKTQLYTTLKCIICSKQWRIIKLSIIMRCFARKQCIIKISNNILQWHSFIFFCLQIGLVITGFIFWGNKYKLIQFIEVLALKMPLWSFYITRYKTVNQS